MKTVSHLLAGFALTATPVLAAPDTDQPHRDWGQVAILDMSQADATACVTREMARLYERIVPVPVENGMDIDGGPGGGFFSTVHDPWLRAKVRNESGVIALRFAYRHPVAAKWITRDVGRMQKRCLKVLRIEPTAPAQ